MQEASAIATLVGLVLALYQLWRTGRIVLQSRRTAEYTTARLADFTVHAQYRELLELQADIDRAVVSDARDAARVLLQHWERRSFELIGMSIVAGVPEDDLRRAALAAREAALKIKNSEGTALATIASTAVSRIGGVCGVLRERSGEQRVTNPTDLEIGASGAWSDFRELYISRRKGDGE